MAFSPESFAAHLRGLSRALLADSMDVEKTEMAAIVRSEVAGSFDSQADAHGAAWPARRQPASHNLLRKSGAMFRAATQHGAAGNIERHSTGELTVGISGGAVHHAAIQNYGSRWVPARQFMYVRSDRLERLSAPLRSAMHRIAFVEAAKYQAR